MCITVNGNSIDLLNLQMYVGQQKNDKKQSGIYVVAATHSLLSNYTINVSFPVLFVRLRMDSAQL